MSAWPVVRLSEVATLSSGGTPSKANAAFWDGDIPWVSPKDMKTTCVTDAEDKITRAAVAESAARIVGANSVLAVVRSGILAHTFPVATLAREVSFNQDIKAITPKNGSLLPAYLFWMLKGQEARILSVGVKKGATVHSLSNGFLEALSFPLPPVEEQRRVAGLLDRAAEISRGAEAARAKARVIIPALFLDMFGEPAINSKEWPIRSFGDAVTSIDFGISAALSAATEWTPEKVPVIRMPNISPIGDLLTDDLRFLKVSAKKQSELSLQAGDLIFNWRNSPKWIGKTTIWDGRMEAIFASFLYRIRLNQTMLIPAYVKTMFNILRANKFFESRVRQAVSQANFGRDELCAVKIAFPPLALQTAFGEQAQRIEATGRALDAAAAKAVAMADALSAKVFE